MIVPYEKFLYIYPPRPEVSYRFDSESLKTLQRTPNWIAELKLNGQRNLLFVDPSGEIQMWGRDKDLHGNYYPPNWLIEQIKTKLQLALGKWHVLDSELLDAKDKDSAAKNVVCFFDVLVHDGLYLVGTTQRERHERLFNITGASLIESGNFVRKLSENLWVLDDIPPDRWEEAWNLTSTSWIEGLVLKNAAAKLRFGLTDSNNSDWQVRVRKLSESGHVGKYG